MGDKVEPLVYTTKGNLPDRLLRYETFWHVSEEQVGFRETHRLLCPACLELRNSGRDLPRSCEACAANEVIKDSTHIHKLKGLSLGNIQNGF